MNMSHKLPECNVESDTLTNTIIFITTVCTINSPITTLAIWDTLSIIASPFSYATCT